MAPHRRSRVITSRRRVEDDEGEEEGSIYGDLDDDSLSDVTASTQPDEDRDDAEGSEMSDCNPDEHHGCRHSPHHPQQPNGNGHHHNHNDNHPHRHHHRKQVRQPLLQSKDSSRAPPNSSAKTVFETRVSETEAMLNGMQLTEETSALEELNFDDTKEKQEDFTNSTNSSNNNPNNGSKAQRRETPLDRRRRDRDRDHEQYLKEKDANPAFVPTRGGFFLHDKRSSGSPPNGPRASNNPVNSNNTNNKPKSKPYGMIVDSNAPRRSNIQKSDVTDGPWQHDLHESVVQEFPPPRPAALPPSSYSLVQPPRPVPTAPRSSPPNRSFSSTVLVGNVAVMVLLPGMKDPISVPAVAKNQHTCLPQHRPPLRRDKPVRISLPGQPPRYIFPGMDRSFIFIPRALRPNQQASYRGRGRGGFYGTRRSSGYAGSTYTASLPMSRRSSMGGVASRNGVGSPVGSIMSRSGMVGPAETVKPIVRLPPNVPPPLSMQPLNIPPPNVGVPPPGFIPQPQLPSHPPAAAIAAPYPGPQPAQFRENRPQPAIPMHQPRPQKTVSVADIESPMAHPPPPPPPPQPTQEQPFHQQMPPPQPMYDPIAYGPPHTRNQSHPPPLAATPLSQIPERAIHAPPFQPVPYQQQQQPPAAYYPAASYPPGPFMYPVEYPAYPGPPTFIPPGQQISYGMPPLPPPPQPQPQPQVQGQVQGQAQGQAQQQQQQSPAATTSDQAPQTGMVAHESNGTVYYYDASQLPGAQYPNVSYNMHQHQPHHHPQHPQHPHPQGGVVGMGGMLTPPGPAYYYPQPPSGTVYYT